MAAAAAAAAQAAALAAQASAQATQQAILLFTQQAESRRTDKDAVKPDQLDFDPIKFPRWNMTCDFYAKQKKND